MDLDFAAIDPTALALAVAGLIGAGIVKGATGLGYATCALPFLVPAVGLQTAVAAILAPAIATNVGVALGAGHLRETWHRFRTFYLATVPGIGVGIVVLSHLDQALATRSLGIIILLYAALTLGQPALTLQPRTARWLMVPSGIATGMITGLTGSQVMPLLPYMMALGLAPDRLVQAINLSVLICSSTLALLLLGTGTVPLILALASLAAVPLALAGVWLGTRLRRHIAPATFRRLMLMVLLGMGLALALR